MANGLFNLKQVMQGIQQGGWNGQKPPAVEYLVVAGGGSGGGGAGYAGGGGGGGGLLQGINTTPNGQTLLVTVGAGGVADSGTGNGTSGSNSVFGQIIATGGGYGSYGQGQAAAIGGSGGGTGANNTSANTKGAQGLSGQGFAGGAGYNTTTASAGGGGGAGTKGFDSVIASVGGNGGAGVSSVISGTVTAYAGGGGGSANNGNTGGTGGVGGGGNGASGTSTNAVSGTANTGGGGGGAGNQSGGTRIGGNGGSGIVIVSYPDTYAAAASTTGSPTVSTSGSGSIVFDGSGDYVRYPTSTNYALGTGDFTVEAFIYRSNLDGMIVDARSGALSQTWCLYLSGANLGWINGSGNPSTSTTVAGTTWTHVAACRSGTTFKLFINGVAGYTGSDSINYTTTSPLLVGINADLSSNPFSGYISNVRITKGTAVYTADFTPPTAPLTKLTNTGLLLNTVSGAVFADSATGATTSGIGGQVAWNASSPFTGTGYKNRVYTWTSSGSITF